MKAKTFIKRGVGPLEQQVRRRARRGAVERAVFTTIALGGMLTVALMAPKVLSLLKEEHVDYIIPKDPKQRLREVMTRMKKKGWITFEKRNGKRLPTLTSKGRKAAEKLSFGALTIKKPLRWDRRWRVVIFDIPEKQHHVRTTIRSKLQTLGFLKLQGSVWVHPYDCEELIALLKTELRLGRSVLYMISDAIEHDRPLREHFNLPKD